MDPRAALLGKNIIEGKVTYVAAVTARPDLKADIDLYLTSKGREDLIVNP